MINTLLDIIGFIRQLFCSHKKLKPLPRANNYYYKCEKCDKVINISKL